MSETAPRDSIAQKRIIYELPGMQAVTVRRDVPYRATDAGPLTMDLYYPPDSASGTSRPAVILVTGYSDIGAEKMLGCRFKEMGAFVSWAQLLAVSGMVAITYANREPADVAGVLDEVRQHAGALQIDAHKLGVFASSGHGPNALAFVMEHGRDRVACAALAYPYTLDLNVATAVGDAAKQFRFATPAAGKSIAALPAKMPIFIARAGADQMPGLNNALDQFVLAALGANLPLTVVNHATGPHAFDLFDDSPASRQVVQQILAFLRSHLSA